MTTTPAPSAVRGARRIAIITIIVSLSLTALVGIVALFSGFGEVQGKTLLTTLVVAGFAVTSLCHLAVVGRRIQLVGFVGIAVSAAAAVVGLVLVWTDWSNVGDWIEGWLRALGVLATIAFSLAHANLLLLLAARRNRPFRAALYATLVMIALLAILICLPILISGFDGGDGYWRFVGVIAILDVLGTIVVPVVGIFVRDVPQVAIPSVPGTVTADTAPTTLTVTVSPDIAVKLAALATSRGVSPESLVSAAAEALVR
ncbi:hypothetical protein [Glaciihabitans sp. dw_435]|uniref:hypothetical protein n=1 Tax=Glaciihabitans sp. dw_435 TaxID=2720081 RepID=UPI001BD34C15|nr:hypothetical protein [Glaciihabitans sp. dw_435]